MEYEIPITASLQECFPSPLSQGAGAKGGIAIAFIYRGGQALRPLLSWNEYEEESTLPKPSLNKRIPLFNDGNCVLVSFSAIRIAAGGRKRPTGRQLNVDVDE